MIKHIQCDIFESGADVICHQVNCQGVMGSGIAKQVKEKFPEVYKEYKIICNYVKNNPHKKLLGTRQFIEVSENKYVVNLFAQDNFGYDGQLYTDYNALKQSLTHTQSFFKHNTIAIPYKLGCDRGGGDWNIVYDIIKDVFKNHECDVLICEYNKKE